MQIQPNKHQSTTDQSKEPVPLKIEIEIKRAAISLKEFAATFGHETTWAYRKMYQGQIKVITSLGRILVPISEVERLTGEASHYQGEKS